MRLVLFLLTMLAACGPNAATGSPRSPDFSAQLIHDPATGLALFGYDPVAYHAERRPVEGSARFDALHGGKVWRFASAANRAAFLADPDAYLPLFGGHDALEVAKGRMTAGDPAHFVLVGGRAAFFRTPEARDAFAVDAQARSRALAAWPDVAARFAAH